MGHGEAAGVPGCAAVLRGGDGAARRTGRAGVLRLPVVGLLAGAERLRAGRRHPQGGPGRPRRAPARLAPVRLLAAAGRRRGAADLCPGLRHAVQHGPHRAADASRDGPCGSSRAGGRQPGADRPGPGCGLRHVPVVHLDPAGQRAQPGHGRCRGNGLRRPFRLPALPRAARARAGRAQGRGADRLHLPALPGQAAADQHLRTNLGRCRRQSAGWGCCCWQPWRCG